MCIGSNKLSHGQEVKRQKETKKEEEQEAAGGGERRRRKRIKKTQLAQPHYI